MERLASISPPNDASETENTQAEEVHNKNFSPRTLRIHLLKHGWALTTVGIVAFVFALSFSQKFLIPLIFSIFIAYTLNPLVCALERLKLPRIVATSMLIGGIMLATGMHVNLLIAEFDSILVQLPAVTHRLSVELTNGRYGQATLIEKVQDAATELERATTEAAGNKVELRRLAPTDQSVIKLREWLFLGSMSLLGFLGQATMVLFLVFFLLLSGDMFKRKLVKLAGPTLHKKKITVLILNHINTSIQRYMFMLLVTNSLVGILSWIAFKIIGVDNAGAWALTSSFLHVIPYFGTVLIAVVTGLAAFMQFNSLSTAFMVAGVSLGITTFVGVFVTTWMTGRIAKMNPAGVFIALLFWGWLWGAWGLLLGIPIIVLVKVVSEHIEGMEAITELLGN
ncbi:putative permease [Solimicrobium silvestre]|uniref:Putative permease n=2 Tax=Solimicrobium silvestre TaxID=2099400 RepID=A0A2S9GXK1_9BURK|nr:putative permease [Solimicrobium silvestre]